MKSKLSIEISRKVLHLSASFIPLGYLFFIENRELMIFILGTISLISILLEIFRREWDFITSIFERFFQFMMRTNESKGSITGATWLLFGSTLTIFLFPKYIAIPALLFLTVGDTFSAIVGKSLPIGLIREKSLSGTLAGIITSSIAGVCFNTIVPAEIIILGAIGAMLIELAPIPLNDNLTIPLTGGIIMTYGMVI